jgi:hypothetical protein
MVLFGKEFDADERAEVGGGYGLGELYEVGDAYSVLLEDRQGLAEDGDPKGLPVVYLKDGGDTVFHRWT